MQKAAILTLVGLMFVSSVQSCNSEDLPPNVLKKISSNLIIESAEQGAFYDDSSTSAELIDPRKFKRLDIVTRPHKFLFGWRMKIRTDRKSILVQERPADSKGSTALAFRTVPRYGYIYNCTDIVSGVKPGVYLKTIFVEKTPVVTFKTTIK